MSKADCIGRMVVCGLVLATWLGGTVGVGVAGAAEPANLIANGGFEEGAAGWEPDPKHELVTAPGAAHSGRACLSGEVSGDRQALVLRKRVPLRAGARYQFEVWAKATGGTKLVLRVSYAGEDVKSKPATARTLVAAWEDLPNKWKKCVCDVPVKSEGTAELQIIAPSSFGAPPGRIWIDDVALYLTELPKMVSITGGQGFND